MNKLATALSTSHTLSLTAMEEASRDGLRTADIEHMFLALALDPGTAGQVLRSMPITLNGARAAVTAHHVAQLGSLGIHMETPAAWPIVFHETGGYEWSDRALDIMKQAGAKGMGGDAPAMLRALLEEPSGLIRSLLARLDITPEAVALKLDDAVRIPPHEPLRTASNALSGSASKLIPATVDRVWAALADPHTIPVWDATIASIEAELAADADAGQHTSDPMPRIGDTWIARARTERSDGKQIRVNPDFMVRKIELTEFSESHLIEWVLTFPDSPKSNAKRVRIELEPAAGGTQLCMSLAWEPRSVRKRIPGLRLIMRPLQRFSIWIQLAQLGDGISRMFR